MCGRTHAHTPRREEGGGGEREKGVERERVKKQNKITNKSIILNRDRMTENSNLNSIAHIHQ